MPNTKISIIEAALLSGFAAIGGILAYIMRTLNREQQPKLSRAVLEGMSSAFIGLIAMLACKALNIDWYWSGVIVGVFGWMGAESSIVLFQRLVRKKLGISDAFDKDKRTS